LPCGYRFPKGNHHRHRFPVRRHGEVSSPARLHLETPVGRASPYSPGADDRGIKTAPGRVVPTVEGCVRTRHRLRRNEALGPWSLPRRESWSQVSATPNLRPRAPGKCRCALAKRLPRRAPSAAAVTLRLESWSQASATLLGQGRATSSSAAWCLRRLPPRWETCPCREPWSPTPLGESPGKCPPLRVGGRLRSSGGCAG
jgi:hypothetical protein